MNFSERLKTICNETGLNLKQISDLSGIAYSSIKKYGQGERTPKIDQIKRISSIPALEPYKELLLDQTELSAEDSEIMLLVGRLRAQGKEGEVIQILRDLQDEGGV
ncbi:helix-turn-helix domain-containing protein [Reinekea sp.]|jgi:transcriptional regulator with XRE-family HTH domain|uniref:helix-turn-helix domain-containing protein n=1 Tax=Reinekea sp. TaxID=1970455 RepID=UPI0039896DF1